MVCVCAYLLVRLYVSDLRGKGRMLGLLAGLLQKRRKGKKNYVGNKTKPYIN